MPGWRSTFLPAAVEIKLDAKNLERRDDQGWSTGELEDIYEEASDEKRAEIEGLVLAANLLHYHNPASFQNKLVCLRGHFQKDTGVCEKPVMYIHDLGSTFGAKRLLRNPRGDFRRWKHKTVFKKGCRVRARFGSIKYISEAGRQFLWQRLQHLDRASVHAIFAQARFDIADPSLRRKIRLRHPRWSEAQLSAAALDSWVEVFMERIAEVRNARCSRA